MAKEPIFKGKDHNGKGVWEIQVSTGVKVNGRYKRVTETFHGTKKDANRRMRQIIADVEQGISIDGGKVAFDTYADGWLKEKSKSIQPRTLAGYTREVERLKGILGSTPIEKINAPIVRDTLNAVRASVMGRNGKPSESTVKSCFRVLSIILGQAEHDDLIRVNACKKVNAPKAEQGERRSMTKEQYLSLLEKLNGATETAYLDYKAKEQHLKDTGHQNKERHALRGIHELSYLQAVRIAHASGMRPSEIFALQWKHVDFDNGCIYVEQATQTAEGGIKETKSKAGKRVVYLNAETLAALATWRTFQASAANALGIELGANAWVCCSDTFTQVHHSNFNAWWRGWAKRNGFEGWQVYELRHTQVTLLLDANADIKTVQTRLGHSSAAVTLGVYAHALESNQRAAAALLPTLQ